MNNALKYQTSYRSKPTLAKYLTKSGGCFIVFSKFNVSVSDSLWTRLTRRINMHKQRIRFKLDDVWVYIFGD